MNWSLQRHLLQRRWLYLPAVAFRRPERRDAAPTATTENPRRASGDGRYRMLNSLFSSRPKTHPYEGLRERSAPGERAAGVPH